MSDIIDITEPAYPDAVELARILRDTCWYLLRELGRHGHPQPVTQTVLQTLEEQHPWVAAQDPTPLEERLTEAEWEERQQERFAESMEASRKRGDLYASVGLARRDIDRNDRAGIEALLDVKLEQTKISLMDMLDADTTPNT